MKALLFLFLCWASCNQLQGQELNEFAAIDAAALQIPESETCSSSSIANYINKHFNTDKEKIRAAYIWVINNIQYDKDSMYHFNCGKDNEIKVAETLRRRKGVCENFASLLSDIVIRTGISSYVVHGYSKEGGSVNWNGHSWCAVLMGNEWLLCDPTWDSGSGSNTNYFLTDPSSFIQLHMPFDPMWQLRPYLITNEEFGRGNYNNTKNKDLFQFSDTANAFMQLDSLQQLEATARRMQSSGLINETLRVWYAYHRMKISIINEEKDMNLYNAATDSLNHATAVYNNFIQYRNKKFIPEKPDSELKNLLEPLDSLLIKTYLLADAIRKGPENFQYNSEELLENIITLQKKVQAQKQFLKKYFAANKKDREQLFYE